MAGLAARAPNQQDATEASARELRKPVVKEYDPHGDSRAEASVASCWFGARAASPAILQSFSEL